MNTSIASEPAKHLLDIVKTFRANLGESINDDELTRLLRETAVPREAGFAFLSFSTGHVMLTVPPQELADWYNDQGWIAPEKEKTARGIAKKYGLLLFEPVDTTSNFQSGQTPSPCVHHHVEMTNGRQTIIVAHPQFIKIRLFGKTPEHLYAWEALCPLTHGCDLLQDLSTLYQRSPETNGQSTVR